MGLGTGTAGRYRTSEQQRLGVVGLSDLLTDAYYENGLNYWDSAEQYGTHEHIARAAHSVGRSNVVIQTKTYASSREGVEFDLATFLEELGTDHIDIVLMHCMTSARWTTERAEAIDTLCRARDAGRVRALGVSCHTLPALDTARQADWVDVLLARVNYDGVRMDGSVSRVLPRLAAFKTAGVGVVGMKILGQGALPLVPAMGFCRTLDIDAFLIGANSAEQIAQAVHAYDFTSASTACTHSSGDI
jgi:aryl-alcohol dehydrogenase-like predicted oxidoreductase